MTLALAQAGADVARTARPRPPPPTVEEIRNLGCRTHGYSLQVRAKESIDAFASAVLAD